MNKLSQGVTRHLKWLEKNIKELQLQSSNTALKMIASQKMDARCIFTRNKMELPDWCKDE